MNNLRHKYFLREAYSYALEHSDDNDTKTGAVLVRDNLALAYGCNSLPEGIGYNKNRLERPLKYKYIEHAERDVLFTMGNMGMPVRGMKMYAPWAACCDCARAIIAFGIEELIVHKSAMNMTPDRWKEDIDIALSMLKEARIKVTYYEGRIGMAKALFDRKIWYP